MPIVAQFYGVVIRMRYRDHAPPHFHAEYGEYELVVELNPIVISEGKAPNRVRSLVLEWTALHQQELLANWQRCRSGQPPVAIEGLE